MSNRMSVNNSTFYKSLWGSSNGKVIRLGSNFCGAQPAYLYMINWRSPVRDGLFLSPHCLELPFVFQNVRHMPEMVGTGPEIQPLADKISGAWVAFARTGIPNHPGIPHWPAFGATQQPTMVINNEWKIVNDLNREERDYIAANYPELPPW